MKQLSEEDVEKYDLNTDIFPENDESVFPFMSTVEELSEEETTILSGNKSYDLFSALFESDFSDRDVIYWMEPIGNDIYPFFYIKCREEEVERIRDIACVEGFEIYAHDLNDAGFVLFSTEE